MSLFDDDFAAARIRYQRAHRKILQGEFAAIQFIELISYCLGILTERYAPIARTDCPIAGLSLFS